MNLFSIQCGDCGSRIPAKSNACPKCGRRIPVREDQGSQADGCLRTVFTLALLAVVVLYGVQYGMRRYENQRIEKQFATVRNAYSDGYFSAAVKLLDEIPQKKETKERLDQERIAIYTAWGDGLLQEGKPEEASAMYNEVLKVDPENAAATDGIKKARKENAKKAARLQKAKRAFSLGKSYRDKGNLPRAIGQFWTSLEYNPDQPQAYAIIAELYLDQDNPDKAIRTLDMALALEGQSRNPFFHYQKARAWEMKKEWKNAVKEYNVVIESSKKGDDLSIAAKQRIRLIEKIR